MVQFTEICRSFQGTEESLFSVGTYVYSTVTVKVGGRKARSSTQSSGMPSKDKLADKSAPRNKASRQDNSNSTRSRFPKKQLMYTKMFQVYLAT